MRVYVGTYPDLTGCAENLGQAFKVEIIFPCGFEAISPGQSKLARVVNMKSDQPFRMVVIEVSGRSCVNAVRVWTLKPCGDHSIAECNRRVSAAVLLKLRPGRSVDGPGNTRSKAQVRIC